MRRSCGAALERSQIDGLHKNRRRQLQALVRPPEDSLQKLSRDECDCSKSREILSLSQRVQSFPYDLKRCISSEPCMSDDPVLGLVPPRRFEYKSRHSDQANGCCDGAFSQADLPHIGTYPRSGVPSP